jgi:hypothetical protein
MFYSLYYFHVYSVDKIKLDPCYEMFKQLRGAESLLRT